MNKVSNKKAAAGRPVNRYDRVDVPAPDSFSTGICWIIADARSRKGMTKARLAELTGISPNSLVKYEKPLDEGGIEPSLKNMTKIAKALEIDPRTIFDEICAVNKITDDDDLLFFYSFRAKWKEKEIDEMFGIYEDSRIGKIVSMLTDIDREIASAVDNADFYKRMAVKRVEAAERRLESKTKSDPDD